MLKKILICAALVGGLVMVGTASLLLNVGAYEPSIETSSTLDTLDMMAKAGPLPEQPAADPI